MSDEEMKGEAGKTVAIVTDGDEEQMYQVVKQLHDDGINDVDEANRALQQWKEARKEVGFSPTDPDLLQLKQDVNDANQRLNDADRRLKDAGRRWKDARAEASKRQKTAEEWEWKPEVEPVYSLKNEEMFFVNQDSAVQQLQDIHQQKYNRARKGSGLNWSIPIAENVIGLGKSCFGNKYIQKCRDAWKDEVKLSDFQRKLVACRTVRLFFTRGELLENAEMVMRDQLCTKLRDMFLKPPVILSKPLESVDCFLEALTREVGPLFIVLDEIGAAFEDDKLSDAKRREHFLSFCRNIVGKWLPLPNVFFLLLGRASFLSFVGHQPSAVELLRSGYVFSRLNFHQDTYEEDIGQSHEHDDERSL